MDNLKLAHKRARKDKSFYKEVKMVDSNPEYYLKQIQDMLKNKTYSITKDDYVMFEKNDKGKIRKIYKLDYFPHRIIQHALLIQIEDIIFKNLIENTFSSLPTRGIHKALRRLDYDLKNYENETQYCLQMDIKKYYPNINHEINKQQYRRLFKDSDLLWLIDILIDSLCLDSEGNIIYDENLIDEEVGIAIGSLFSQWDGNFNLSEFDHWLKEKKKVRFYYRYCDDLVVLGSDKAELHELRKEIQIYLKEKLKLDLKDNYKVYPVDIQGIDFVGYRHFRKYILLRKTISQKLIRTMRDIQNKINDGGKFNYTDYCSINGFMGWLKWCNGHNLYIKWIEPLMPYYNEYYINIIKNKKCRGDVSLKRFSDFAKEDGDLFKGNKVKINDIINEEVEVLGFKTSPSKFGDVEVLTLQIKFNGELRVVFTGSNILKKQIQKYRDEIPFYTTIIKSGKSFVFS